MPRPDGPIALGFRAHSGWAVVVAVSGTPAHPNVGERRRIEIADGAIPGSKQPFHAAENLDLVQAEALIRRCRERSEALATAAIRALAAQLGEAPIGSGLVAGSGRPLPGLEAILRSHALLHTAEGEFYRDVIAQASEACKFPVKRIAEREIWERGAALFHQPSDALRRQVDALARSLGPPWRQDEKLAALAAWIALAESE
jgi:hypothetical protein